MSELDEARANHGLTLGLLAKVIKERDQWKERAIELQAEPAAMACAMLQQDDLLDAYRSLAKAADRMYAIGLRATDEWHAYATARTAVTRLEGPSRSLEASHNPLCPKARGLTLGACSCHELAELAACTCAPHHSADCPARSTPATTEQKAAAGKGGAVEE